MRANKIFNAFLVIMASTILFLLPLTESVEAFLVDTQTDYFSVSTGVGVTTANVVFSEPLYDEDTTSIDMLSDLNTDTVGWNTYNATANRINLSGLTGNATRTITATYDVDAIGNAAIVSLANRLPWFWLLLCIAFGPTALAAIFTDKL